MSKSNKATPLDQETLSESSTGTDTSVASPTASTKGKAAPATKGTKAGSSGRAGTSHLGLVIEPMLSGLYRVKNRAGGNPPKQFNGLYTTLTQLTRDVRQWNKDNNKEG